MMASFVDDTNGLHSDGPAGACLDGSHCDFEGFVGDGAVEVFAYFFDLDTKGVADQSELAGPVAGDGFGERDQGW